MAGKKHRWIRIFGWILLGFVSLVLLVTLAFYLGRDRILHRALDYVNDNQPGEVQVGRINLVPFLGFPDAVLQLRNISYYERKLSRDSLYQEPILSLDEIYLSLDVVDLVRGEFSVSRSRLGNGFVRMEVYEDGISNIERALGISFDAGSEKDSTAGMPDIHLNMDRLQIGNVLLIYRDRTRDDRMDLMINRLESRISYLPEMIDLEVQLDVDVRDLKYFNINIEKNQNITLASRMKYDALDNSVDLHSGSLSFAGLVMDAWGTYRQGEQPGMDLAFRAKNSGLELLNFLFRGVLDLDEIEQIGDGQMTLSGNISGIPGDRLPVIRLNGQADRLGFRIRSIGRDVTGISFKFYATNGRMADLSEAMLHLEGLTATFPEGVLHASLTATNAVTPEVKVKMNGDVELDGLESMIETDMVSSLAGKLAIHGDLHGVIDRNNRDFLKEAGEVTASLQQVSFIMIRDTVVPENGMPSAVFDTIRDLTGEVYLRENRIWTDRLGLELNGNRIELGARIDNLLLYLLDYETELNTEITLASEVIYPGRILQDTTIEQLLGSQLNDLRFHAGMVIQGRELDRFLEADAIPSMEMEIMDFGVEAPVFNDISEVRGKFSIDSGSIVLADFGGKVGESMFRLGGSLENYPSLLGLDSIRWAGISFDLSSEYLRAKDFFTYRDSFMLPPEYRDEYLGNFRLKGNVTAPGRMITTDPGSMDFHLDIEEMEWDVGFYPDPFRNFLVRARREGDRMMIDTLRGFVGESSLMLSADLSNFTDTVMENWRGSLVIGSDLLDLDRLMDFTLPGDQPDSTRDEADSLNTVPPPGLDRIAYPNVTVRVDIKELVFEDTRIFGLHGRFRTTREKVLFLDRLEASTESGGGMALSGQFNVSDPHLYTFSSEFDIRDLNVRDLAFEMESDGEVYTLERNFRGLVSANGLAEVFISPDFTFDLDNTTAVFNVKVDDGAIIDFSPLQVAGKYLDNRDLNNVRFATLQNSFPLTLSEGKIHVPLTIVESTLGQLLIEGEQGLDNSFLYLLRLPTWLVRDAARGMLTRGGGDEDSDQIYEMKMGKFLVLTVYSDGIITDVKTGDRRDRYRGQK